MEKSNITLDNISAKLRHIASLHSISEFLAIYSTIENDWMDQESFEFEAFKSELEKQQNECDRILSSVSHYV